jgi:hypothetical protein
MLLGLIKGLGKRFEMVVEIEEVPAEASSDEGIVFKITW